MPTIGRLIDDAASRLASAGIASARLDAEVLLARVLGCGRASLLARRDQDAGEEVERAFRPLVARRLEKVPVAYLTGTKEFWSLDFEVGPHVLVPRPETELLVEEGIRRLGGPAGRPRIADVGTGAGPIAVALAHEIGAAQVHAIDNSPGALDVARRNAARHGVAARIAFHLGDLLAPVLEAGMAGSFDLVVSNPPYVGFSEPVDDDVRLWEPRDAVYGGRVGDEVIERLIPQAARALRPGGSLLFEISPAREAFARRSLASGAGAVFWTEPCTLADLAGLPRVVAARRTGEVE